MDDDKEAMAAQLREMALGLLRGVQAVTNERVRCAIILADTVTGEASLAENMGLVVLREVIDEARLRQGSKNKVAN